jgi:general stress protein YciG
LSGTKKGGFKAADTNKKRYGKDFYKKIGSVGGKKTGVKKGFAANPSLAREAGKKGGRKSKRTKLVK